MLFLTTPPPQKKELTKYIPHFPSQELIFVFSTIVPHVRSIKTVIYMYSYSFLTDRTVDDCAVGGTHEWQAKKRELEERCQSQATAVSLTQQGQIETCLTYRLFAVGQLHQRYRRLRLFFAQLGCRVAARASQATHLCGGDSEAQERVKMLGICLNLGIVEEACLRWTAVQNERQLVEGMDREVS